MYGEVVEKIHQVAHQLRVAGKQSEFGSPSAVGQNWERRGWSERLKQCADDRRSYDFSRYNHVNA
jgi:hypothetical protein